MKLTFRYFVAVQPFRPTDVSIFPDTPAGRRAADRLITKCNDQGKKTKLFVSTGSLNDLKSDLQALREEHQ